MASFRSQCSPQHELASALEAGASPTIRRVASCSAARAARDDRGRVRPRAIAPQAIKEPRHRPEGLLMGALGAMAHRGALAWPALALLGTILLAGAAGQQTSGGQCSPTGPRVFCGCGTLSLAA